MLEKLGHGMKYVNNVSRYSYSYKQLQTANLALFSEIAPLYTQPSLTTYILVYSYIEYISEVADSVKLVPLAIERYTYRYTTIAVRRSD